MSTAASLSARVPDSWSAALWSAIDSDLYPAVLAHPFITGLTDGSLAPEAFAHYVAQDVLYLREYARALTIVSAKAPTLADTAMFARHAAEVQDVELALHRDLLPQLGLDADALAAARPGPTTRAYTSYLLATCHGGSFADGLAAVLPCYWIYARVGAELLHRGSPEPRYQSWIDSYGGEDFTKTVLEVLELTDRTGRTLTPEQEQVARDHFVVTSRYEWMFFDAALRREEWPV
jgi:thiaminase/transcriptional activator TenA